MEEAVRQGVERVFIIHGIGKGHLRNLITATLIRNPNVITFKNEFHRLRSSYQQYLNPRPVLD